MRVIVPSLTLGNTDLATNVVDPASNWHGPGYIYIFSDETQKVLVICDSHKEDSEPGAQAASSCDHHSPVPSTHSLRPQHSIVGRAFTGALCRQSPVIIKSKGTTMQRTSNPPRGDWQRVTPGPPSTGELPFSLGEFDRMSRQG